VLHTLACAPSVCPLSLTTQHRTLAHALQINTEPTRIFALTALLIAQRVPIQPVCALDAWLLLVPILPQPVPVAVFQPIKLYSTERVFHCSAALFPASTIQVTILVSTAQPRIV
jgi:hypothetical protein